MYALRSLLALWVLSLWSASGTAVDLTKIDRTIKKEPAYKTQPKYCLVVLGAEAKTRVWLVLDGDVLYVDRNGNGGLTEPGKQAHVTTPNQDPASFEEIEITAGDGKPSHRFQLFLFGWFNLRFHKEGRVEPCFDVSWTDQRRYGAWGDERSPLVFASRPEDAPIVHIGAPLRMGFEIRRPLEKVSKDTFKLSAGVGTPGVGPGTFAHLRYNVIPEDVFPKATLEFPSKTRGGTPIKVEMVLRERC